MNSLDFYAKIEPLLGFYEEYEILYKKYIQILHSFELDNILDIGCGNGQLLRLLKQNGIKAEGIERSAEMLKRASTLGVSCTCKELSDFNNETFDCALAVGDVLNYMNHNEIDTFFIQLSGVIKKGGYFLADINTLMGFEVADGVMSSENKTQFLVVDASFENKELHTKFTLFEKEKELYKKSTCSILQYYHSLEKFKSLKDFHLIDIKPVSMFSQEDEKALMILQKKVT